MAAAQACNGNHSLLQPLVLLIADAVIRTCNIFVGWLSIIVVG